MRVRRLKMCADVRAHTSVLVDVRMRRTLIHTCAERAFVVASGCDELTLLLLVVNCQHCVKRPVRITFLWSSSIIFRQNINFLHLERLF